MAARVLIGTLYCGEGDFDACRASVREQRHPCEQFVVSHLPEPQANYELYRPLSEGRADYLVRLDADMVLSSPDAVGTMVARIQGTPYEMVSHHVDDFFTASPMMGVHIYARSCEFDLEAIRAGSLFPDRCNSTLRAPAQRRHLVWKTYDECLVRHCHHATPVQAFHFGYHRWLKRQEKVCRLVLEHWERRPDDERLRLAVMGMHACAMNSGAGGASYGVRLEGMFEAARDAALPAAALAADLGLWLRAAA